MSRFNFEDDILKGILLSYITKKDQNLYTCIFKLSYVQLWGDKLLNIKRNVTLIIIFQYVHVEYSMFASFPCFLNKRCPRLRVPRTDPGVFINFLLKRLVPISDAALYLETSNIRYVLLNNYCCISVNTMF